MAPSRREPGAAPSRSAHHGYVTLQLVLVTAVGDPELAHEGTGVGPEVFSTTLPRPLGSTKATVTGWPGPLAHQLVQVTWP